MIKLDTTGTTSLLTGTSTLESTVDNEEDATTTALLTASTLSSTMPIYAHAEMSQRYIDSLSDNELIEMEQRLSEKENEMSLKINGEEIKLETPKTYKKV